MLTKEKRPIKGDKGETADKGRQRKDGRKKETKERRPLNGNKGETADKW